MRHSPGVSRLQDTSPHPSVSLSPHTSCFPAIFPLSARVSHLGHFLAYTDINISNRIVFFLHFFFYIILPSFRNEMLILYGLRWSQKSTNIRSSKGINYVVWWIYNQLNLKIFSMYSQEEKRNECPFCLQRMIYCFHSIGSGASPTISVAANSIIKRKALLSTSPRRIQIIGCFTFQHNATRKPQMRFV